MKIDLSYEFKDLKGATIQGADGSKLTLSDVASQALLLGFQGEEQSAEEKVKRFKLAQRLGLAVEVEVKAEDIVLIKQCVGRAFGALIVGPAFDILDA